MKKQKSCNDNQIGLKQSADYLGVSIHHIKQMIKYGLINRPTKHSKIDRNELHKDNVRGYVHRVHIRKMNAHDAAEYFGQLIFNY